MPIQDIPGWQEIFNAYGKCAFCDFPNLEYFCLDTTFNDDRGRFTKNLTIRMNGKKGRIEISLLNVSKFELNDINQITGLDIKFIRDHGWENINFEIYDYEESDIKGYSETASIAVIS